MTGKKMTAFLMACLLGMPSAAPLLAKEDEPTAVETPFAEVPAGDASSDSVSAAQSSAEGKTDADKLEALRTRISKGSIGFFEYVRDLNDRHSDDAARALSVFDDEKLSSYTNLNDAADAISLKQMKQTFDALETCNAIRYDNDLHPLNVSLYLTAVAQKQLNYSDTSLTHALAFSPSGENLAWGVKDPFEEWYTKEKAIFDKYAEAGLDADQIYSSHRGEVSHYLEIVDPRYNTTGLAHNENAGYGETDDAWDQVFGMAEGGYSVAEYRSLFDAYCKKLKTELEEVSVPMHRLYNYDSGEHFYTGDENEYQELLKQGWKDEEIGWYAPKSSDQPVYRVYNLNSGDHHYTRDAHERDELVRLGWKDEGIGWYSAGSDELPLYRQYNPNARSGSHNYTTSKEENDKLVELGWKPEDIGWYGIRLIG